MGKVSWIKIAVDMFSNRKIKIILKEKGGDTYFRIWLQLLIISGECNANGKLIISENNPMSVKDFAKIMSKSETKMQKIINKFIELEMIIYKDNVYIIKNWNKYQNVDGLEKIREQNRVRQKRFQDKKKVKNNVNQTLYNTLEENIKESENNKDTKEIDNVEKVGENASGFKDINF